MKKIKLFLLAAMGLVLFNSCQEVMEEVATPLEKQRTTLNNFEVIDNEDATQYLDNDKMLPKGKITNDLLAAVEEYYAAQSQDNVDFRVHCTEVCDGLGGMPVFCETFDDAQLGSVADNSIYFERWNPNSLNDGTIVTNYPNNFLRIDRRIQSMTHADNEEDDLLLLGTENQGCYSLRFEMYIGSCATAYFDIQKRLREEVLIAFTFNKFGRAVVELPDGTTNDFTYPEREWFEVEIHFNIDNLPFNPVPPFNMIEVPNANTLNASVNGTQVAQVSTMESLFSIGGTTNNIQGVNFYPLFRSSKFYVDNICFSFLGDPRVDGGD